MDDEPIRRARTLTTIAFAIMVTLSTILLVMWDPDEGGLENAGTTVLAFMGGAFFGLLALALAIRWVLLTRELLRIHQVR